MSDMYVFALANFALSMAVAFVAFCRLNAMHGSVLRRVMSEYAVYMGAALTSALQPWWGEWPRWGSIALATALLWGLLCSSYAWRRGPPVSASTQPGDLTP